jgi:prepilin-type N-terminal cleavage/methylation domain-containing protein
VVKRQRGFTMLELVVSITVFGVFLMILMLLTAEMRAYEKKLPVNFMKHPQTSAMLSRIRKDVLDGWGKEPFVNYKDYTQGKKTLVMQSVQENGGRQTIVWDFSTPNVAKRIAFNVGVATTWTANGVPVMTVDAIENEDGTYAVRLIGVDDKGRTSIDQILQVRGHQ